MSDFGGQPALAAEEVTVAYGSGAGAAPVLHGVSIAIPRGQTLGLVGESGSGKSTLARAVVGLLRPREGKVMLGGSDFYEMRGRAAQAVRRRIQLIPQDPYGSLDPRRTVGQTLAEAIDPGTRVRGRSHRERVSTLLNMVSLTDTDARRYPHEFSGGQRQRIAIARALAVGPEVIVADEITSALDNSVQAEVLNLLRDIQRQTSITMLFISHNLSVVRYMSDTIAVMYLGRVIEQGASSVFSEPHHPYTKVLLESIPDIAADRLPAPPSVDLEGAGDPAHPPKGCAFHPRCPQGPSFRVDRAICGSQIPLLATDSHGGGRLCACHFPIGEKSGAPASPSRRDRSMTKEVEAE